MSSLAIYAAVNDISLALKQDARITEQIWPGPTARAEDLPLFIDEFMAKNQTSFDELDNISVAIGYGAFTGLRLSLIAAKSIALKYQLELYALPTMQAFANQIIEEKKLDDFIASIYACRQEYNCVLYQQQQKQGEDLTIPWDQVLELQKANNGIQIVTEKDLIPSARGLFLIKDSFPAITSREKIVALSPIYSHSARIQKSKKKELSHLKAIYDS